MYTSLKQSTPAQDKVYTELNTRAVYTSLDPQTTQKDGEYTHVLTKESTLDLTPTQQCTSHSRVVGGGAHSTPGDTMYTALDPSDNSEQHHIHTTQWSWTAKRYIYIDVVDGHEGVSEIDCTTTSRASVPFIHII